MFIKIKIKYSDKSDKFLNPITNYNENTCDDYYISKCYEESNLPDS